MPNYTTTLRKESKTYPGVFYTLSKMSEARRAKLRLDIAPATSKVRSLLRDMRRLEEVPVDERTADQLEDLMRMADELDTIAGGDIDPAWLRWGLRKLEGLTIDDVEADVEMLISDGPPALFSEIVDVIKKTAQLNGEDEKNSESPIISGGVMGGTTTDTTAPPASSQDSTELETATSTSQS
jgi:hypothetical protein